MSKDQNLPEFAVRATVTPDARVGIEHYIREDMEQTMLTTYLCVLATELFETAIKCSEGALTVDDIKDKIEEFLRPLDKANPAETDINLN